MAITLNTNIKNDTDGYLLDAKNVKGGYLSVDTLANLQSFSLNTKEAGSFAYVRENSKFYTYNGTSWQETKFYDDTEIKNIIPAEANVNNKLADKNYVSERMAQISSGTAIHSYDVMFALFAQYIYDKLVADGIDMSNITNITLIKQSIGITISNSTTETIITLDEALTNANLDINHIMSLVNYDYIDNKIKDVKGSFMLSLSSSWNYINDGDIDITEMFTTHGITDLEPLSQTFKLKSANVGDNIYIVSQGVPDLWLAIKVNGGLGFMSLDSSVDLSNIESSVSSINTEINSVKSALDLKADKKDVSEVDINLEGTSTTVSIPENTTGYGSIEKLGGKSYKSENLIVLNDVAETTINGITYSIKDGVITLNGTSSSFTTINLSEPLILNGDYVLNFFNEFTTSKANIRFTSDLYWTFYPTNRIINFSTTNTQTDTITINIAGDTTFTNSIIKPMLVKGSTAPSEFKQGFEGIKTEYPTNVKIVGTNLLNIADKGETTTNGITYSIKDGVITLNGTSTATLNFERYDITKLFKQGQTYFIKQFTDNENIKVSIGRRELSTSDEIYLQAPITFTYNGEYSIRLFIQFTKDVTYNNTKASVSIVKGSTAPTTFKPYTEQNLPQTNIINYISNELQTNHSWTSENASKWLGLGVSDSNIIDYANKKAIVKYGIVDLGTLSWTYRSSDGLYGANLSDSKAYSTDIVANAICSRFEIVSRNNMVDKTFSINNEKSLCAFNTSYTNATDFKNAMSGVMLIYELATPIEIDISEIESEAHFECESNGTIIHDSITNYKYSFPVSLKGQVELNFEHDKEQQRDIDNLYSQINSINTTIGNISAILDNINGEVI